MNILAIYDKSGPKYHRILMPVHMMAGVEVTVKYITKEEDFAGKDIVFFNRNMPGNIDDILLWRDRYGFKMVCDFDDHYVLDKDHFLADHYRKHNITDQLKRWIEVSDAITVTHERLYYELLPLNQNIHILPNAIAQTDQFIVNKVPDEYTRLFWCGSPTHKRDLELMIPAFKKIDRSNVKFIIGGYDKREREWFDMANLYTNHGRWRSQVIEAIPVHEYYRMYSLCDIALVPLVDNHFNRNKSNLKILEAANMKAPVIVSRVHPYLDFPEGLVNYVDMHQTFYSQINKLLKDPERAKEQGLRLHYYCERTYNFNKINEHRKQVFEHVTAQQGALREA